jgi:hypothetical protein
LDEGGVRLAVRVTPGADRDRIEGMEADAAGRQWLRVRLAAPPVDGKANQALVKFLAKRWRMPKSALEIASGATARNKILTIRGDAAAIMAAIEAEI